jgi:hypothetical protein
MRDPARAGAERRTIRPVNEQERRIGLNEAVFRQVNEQISHLADRLQGGEHQLDLICECGDASCVERISMPTSAYEAMRAESTQFAVYPGHDRPAVERVVATGKGYEVIEKVPGMPTELARRTDPRRA